MSKKKNTSRAKKSTSPKMNYTASTDSNNNQKTLEHLKSACFTQREYLRVSNIDFLPDTVLAHRFTASTSGLPVQKQRCLPESEIELYLDGLNLRYFTIYVI